jgi:hypothetical protein
MCGPGYNLNSDGKRCELEDTPYLMVVKGNQIIDQSLSDDTKGFFTPIVGIENGRVLDYDRLNGELYFVEGNDLLDNVRGELFFKMFLNYF